MIELHLALDVVLVGTLVWEKFLYDRAVQNLEQAYHNDNFGCYNRVGAVVKGNAFLKREQRRVKSGDLVMVAIDIAGMGRKNSEIGEEAVNKAISSSLSQIRKFREVEFISQLNSGDEFCFIADFSDVNGLVDRIDSIFRKHGFDGVYAASVEICGDYIETANTGMKKVYQLKLAKKNSEVISWI